MSDPEAEALKVMARIAPADALPFDPVEFVFTVNYAIEMSRSSHLLCNPADGKLRLVDEDTGAVQILRFTDTPLNRFGTAVVRRYRDNLPSYYSFMYRWMALADLIESGALDPQSYRKGVVLNSTANLVSSDLNAPPCGKGEAGNSDWIAEDVVRLAAAFPLNEQGKFNPKMFRVALVKPPA